ncbi:GUN4 domain-containing protein [Dapis sp. BLCC M126]|uniref:GUN4 domain-containing protein n=1 Tax=Dapis sp. BLCC M126 TaxID=3400189 RepID=UPI003CE99D91
MSSSLEESIVLISSSKKANVIGTGFAFYKVDNYTYLLTCAHVVEGVGGEENLLVNNIPAKVVATGDVNGFDLAVLGVEKLSIPLFQLISLSEAENQKFRIAGHYLYGENKNIMLETVNGSLGKKRFARQNNETVTAWNLLINEGDRLRQGYSGAPVVDMSDRVLGVATNMEKDGAEGLAISVEALNKIWPEMPLAISQQLKLKIDKVNEDITDDIGTDTTDDIGTDTIDDIGTDSLPVLVGDYTKLEILLRQQEWKKANEETDFWMLIVAGRENAGWLRIKDIANFPCTDLHAINQLWVKYSGAKFGFSVQKKIYQDLGGKRTYNKETWEKFAEKVGWRQRRAIVWNKWMSYSELTFNKSTPYMGHLPTIPGLTNGKSPWEVIKEVTTKEIPGGEVLVYKGGVKFDAPTWKTIPPRTETKTETRIVPYGKAAGVAAIALFSRAETCRL